MKLIKILYLLKRNVEIKMNTFVKLGIYIYIYLPIIFQVIAIWFQVLACRKKWNSNSGKVPKKVVKLIAGNEEIEYKSQLWLLNILQLPMLIQLNELLLVSKTLKEENRGVELPEVHTNETRNNRFFSKCRKFQQRKRAANSPFKPVKKNLGKPVGLKNETIRTMWNFSK